MKRCREVKKPKSKILYYYVPQISLYLRFIDVVDVKLPRDIYFTK